MAKSTAKKGCGPFANMAKAGKELKMEAQASKKGMKKGK